MPLFMKEAFEIDEMVEEVDEGLHRLWIVVELNFVAILFGFLTRVNNAFQSVIVDVCTYLELAAEKLA